MSAYACMCVFFFFFLLNEQHILELSLQCSSAVDGERRREVSPGIKKSGVNYESSVIDEVRPSSSHLHTENGPLTQLLSNNTAQLNPHLSYRLPPIPLDCLHLASATISHISVFLPATSDACGSLFVPFKKTFCLWFVIKPCQVYVSISLSQARLKGFHGDKACLYLTKP